MKQKKNAYEPTGNLDKKTGEVIIDLLLQCHKESHMGLIVSSHDPAVINKMDIILSLENGLLFKSPKGIYV